MSVTKSNNSTYFTQSQSYNFSPHRQRYKYSRKDTDRVLWGRPFSYVASVASSKHSLLSSTSALTTSLALSVCANWVLARLTLRASLSGTILQTLPDSVTPLKGHSLSPRSCPATRSVPSERFGYQYDCRSNLAPKHARKYETHPPRVKQKRVPSRFKRLWFYLCWCKLLCWRL